MNKRLFVAGIPFETTQDELQALFATAGNVVSVTIISDRETGRSKGFGFVEMQTAEEAQNAISKLNNSDFAGRKLIVNEARPMETKSRSSYDDRRQSGGGNSFGRNRNDRNFRGQRNRY